MSQSSFSSRSRETLPMQVENMTFMLERLHKDCSPLQLIRELTENAIEAIQQLPPKTGEIIWDVDWNEHTLTRNYKLAVIDTGIGMTGEEMVQYINKLSSSIHEQSIDGNYGVGAKIAAVPKNKAGLVYLSWKDGVGYMTHVWRDPDTDIYGLRKFDRPDGSAEYWTIVDNAVRPEQIKDHGTMVVLLGNELTEDTMQPPPGTSMPSRWILRYLNSRYYRFPKSITVKAREGWVLPKGDSHNFLRRVTGMKSWLDKNASDSGSVSLTNAQAHWWILNQDLDLDAGHYAPGGHISALYQDELYELYTGRAGVTRLQAFGIIFGHKRVVLYIEPATGLGFQLTPNTARTSLLLNGESLPWDDWADEFREKMPSEIKLLIEEVGASTSTQDHSQSIRERLKQISELFKFSRYRPTKTGGLTVDDQNTMIGGSPDDSDLEKKKASEKHGGGRGGRAGDIYALFQVPQGVTAEAIRSILPDPKIMWVTAVDNTRTPPDLEDRAAKFIPQQNLLLINADFRLFTDMVERWCKRYSQTAGARKIVESVVREWFEQQLLEAVIGALALRGSSNQWTMQDIEKLWSEEALTAAVLPRYHIDVNVKRALGAKLGSLKEQVA